MMWLSVHDVFQPKWTDQIHEEWMRNVLKDREDLTRMQLERTRRLMDEHAGDCLVKGHERHIPGLSLPDPDDRHVLAAAIEAEAKFIVTWNEKDFPMSVIGAFGIRVLTPDGLICALMDTASETVLSAMKQHRASLKNPPKSAAEYLETLMHQGLKQTVERLQTERARI